MLDLRNVQARKWQLTFNNPLGHGWTHEVIIDTVQKLTACVYFCLCDETGFEGTYHTHLFIACKSSVRASTLANLFPGVHREFCRGTSQQNRDYVRKEGKFKDTEKETTNHKDTFYEWGELPLERPGQRNDLADLYDMVKDGYSDYQILESDPKYMLHMDKLDKVRQSFYREKFDNSWRELQVHYVFGQPGLGKTRTVMETWGYDNVYRVTDYRHPFDTYQHQDVILFDEYHSNFPIGTMNHYLDGYPLELPARYYNRIACFTKVYIVSNIDLRDQYVGAQREDKNTWQGFLRRIKDVTVFTADYVKTYKTAEYIAGIYPFVGTAVSTPFD